MEKKQVELSDRKIAMLKTILVVAKVAVVLAIIAIGITSTMLYQLLL